MKPNRLLALFIGLVLLVGCSKDSTEPDTPKPEPPPGKEELYFGYEPAENLFGYDEVWLMIQDANGKLLDYAQEHSGEKLEFKAMLDTIEGPLTITELTYAPYSENSFRHVLITRTGFPVGTTLVPKVGEGGGHAELKAKFKVNISEIPVNNLNTWPSSTYAFQGAGGGYVGTGFIKNGLYNAEFNINAVEGKEDMIMCVWDGYDDLKYKFLENINGQDFNLVYGDDFQDVEDVYKLDIADAGYYFMEITGYKQDGPIDIKTIYGGELGYKYINWSTATETLPYIIYGFPSPFVKFYINFYAELPDFKYHMQYGGNKPDALTTPTKPTFAVDNRDIRNFQFHTDLNLEHSEHTWGAQKTNPNGDGLTYYTVWELDLKKERALRLHHVPKEILDRFPNMDIDNLTNRVTNITVGAIDTDNKDWKMENYKFPTP